VHIAETGSAAPARHQAPKTSEPPNQSTTAYSAARLDGGGVSDSTGGFLIGSRHQGIGSQPISELKTAGGEYRQGAP